MLRAHEGKWFFSGTNYLICDCSRSNQITEIAPYVRTNFDKLQVPWLIWNIFYCKRKIIISFYKLRSFIAIICYSFVICYFVYFFIPPSTYAPVTNHIHRSDSRYINTSRIMVKIMKWIFAKKR